MCILSVRQHYICAPLSCIRLSGKNYISFFFSWRNRLELQAHCGIYTLYGFRGCPNDKSLAGILRIYHRSVFHCSPLFSLARHVLAYMRYITKRLHCRLHTDDPQMTHRSGASVPRRNPLPKKNLSSENTQTTHRMQSTFSTTVRQVMWTFDPWYGSLYIFFECSHRGYVVACKKLFRERLFLPT